jgi:hypothetical protein
MWHYKRQRIPSKKHPNPPSEYKRSIELIPNSKEFQTKWHQTHHLNMRDLSSMTKSEEFPNKKHQTHHQNTRVLSSMTKGEEFPNYKHQTPHLIC